MRRFGSIHALALTIALSGSQSLAQSAPLATDQRLDLFLHVLRSHSGGAAGAHAPPISQSELERVLRMLPATSVGHGGGPPLIQSAQGVATPAQDPSIYGFCYQACRTERAVGSCGTPAPGLPKPPQKMCRAIEFTPVISAIIGLPFGAGASPFVDDNKTDDDTQQPAGYTFLGQFIDHDVTRTQTALVALGQLNLNARSDAKVRSRLAVAGITTDQLTQAIANAAVPGSALSVNTGKLDLDSVYGVASFAALTGINAPWFEQLPNGAYTGRFAQRHVQAPATIGRPINGFDYQRSPDGAAEIPDPRNSENKIISQIQNLFELAHNDCIDKALHNNNAPTQQDIGAAFDACHKKVIWTYETIVATDFLPRFSADATLHRVAPKALHAYVRGMTPTSTLPSPDGIQTSLYSCKPGIGDEARIAIPHEFAVAAFRLGHTLVRNDYVLHDLVLDTNGNILTGQHRPIFAAATESETTGLVGDNPLAPRDVIDWSYFYDTKGVGISDETAQPGRGVDTLISDKLFVLPVAALPPGPDANGKDTSTERNLPRRNLLRASDQTSQITGSVALGTGEEVEAYAQQRIPDLYDATGEVQKLLGERLKSAGFDPNSFTTKIPLWPFILAEAEGTQAGQRLGELGSHIIDEFLLGSLRCDQGSVFYAAVKDLRGWGPTDLIAKQHRYSMPELISYLQADAKVDGHPISLFSRMR
jgi:heme peroxidase